jgi:REP element-mobilizing transposase RayT
VHHVYARGIEKRDIYIDDLDRDEFLGRVGINLSKWNVRCCAWALMPNHFHFLLQSVKGCLPSFMHCLLTGYSKYFNDRHKRVGHLFQNRYKSPIVREDGYFREVVRYIHLNPLRSGIVPSVDALEAYPWTGHKRIVHGGAPEWQTTDLLQLEFYGTDADSGWIRNYRDFLEMMATVKRDHSVPEDDVERSDSREIPSLDLTGPRKVFTDLLQRISALHGVPVERVLAGDRDYIVVDVRRAVLKMCKARTGIPVSQLARWIGMKESAARYLMNSGQ